MVSTEFIISTGKLKSSLLLPRADSIEGLATRVREYLTRERGHRGYPFASSYDKNSMPRAPLTKFLSESYFGSSPDEEDSKVWELLKETNGQVLRSSH